MQAGFFCLHFIATRYTVEECVIYRAVIVWSFGECFQVE